MFYVVQYTLSATALSVYYVMSAGVHTQYSVCTPADVS